MSEDVFDIFIAGGGINGCGIARDAAGRGYSVCLAEMDDLASGTSSRSTKLIHGGLRYLEHYEFRLVREALREREVLWKMAPHIIWPLRFVLPHHKGLRPAWLLRLGLFLYDHLGGGKLLPGTAVRDLRRDPLGAALKSGYTKAFEYSDCWVDDARLVILNAMDAAERGARIRTRTKLTAARREGALWVLTTINADGTLETVKSRMLINAAGPWVSQILEGSVDSNEIHAVRLVKGSHIVVRRLYEDDRCFFFQNTDGRIFFAIPYEDEFTLIGTTDQDFDSDPARVSISQDETEYLLAAARAYFSDPPTAEDIVWSYSGVRPLYDDGASKAQEATRDYVLKRSGGEGTPPLLSVIGGKITTYRRLAESALGHVEAVLGPRKARWTARSKLPGGDFPPGAETEQVERLIADFDFLTPGQARRLVRTYGTLARTILGVARTREHLGPDFGAGLTGAEVRYLAAYEWARTSDDILWRRTKLGLHADRIDIEALDQYLAAQLHDLDAPTHG